MKRFPVLLAAAATAALYGTANAGAEIVSNESVALDTIGFVSCAAGGAGEAVQLTGSLHLSSAVTSDSAGGTHVTTHFNPQGVSGVGLTTGASYRGTGVTRATFNARVGEHTTVVNNFRLIGAGGAPSYSVHEVLVLVFNANGVVTASFDKLSVSCG